MGPPSQDAVDVPEGWVESRFVVTAVVVDPASDVAVEHPRQIVQRFVSAVVQRPASHRLSDRFPSLVAGRGTERDADPTLPSSRQPRPECIAEEVELAVGIVTASILILAVDDLRLLRMKRQPAEPNRFSSDARSAFACSSLRQWQISSSA